MEEMTKKFYFKNLQNDLEWQNELDKITSQGWRVVSAEPIEEVSIKIVGRKFILKKS